MSCSEEFGLYLTANPQYYEVFPPEDPEAPFFAQYFICSNGEIRRYDNVPVTRYQAFIDFLTQNPQYGGLTDEGRIAFGVTGEPTQTLFSPGSGFFLHNYIDASEYYIWFDPAIVNPANLAVLAANPTWVVVL